MDRFSFSCTPARQENIILADHCRITVLTPCLLRFETGTFTDLPTQTVWHRDLGQVNFSAEKQGDLLTIRTDEAAFAVDVRKCRMKSVTLSNGTCVTNFDTGVFPGTARTLDMANGSVKLEKGILSQSGVSRMDDSRSLLLQQDGTIQPRKKCCDQYYFAYGRDYRRWLRDFFRLTGQVPLIPKYALGNWWSRYKAYTQEEYQSLMQTFLDRNIPITVATIDMDWHWTDVLERFGEQAKPTQKLNPEAAFYDRFMPGWTGYSWNTELFPDHRKLLSWLHEKGFHVTLNVHPSQGIRFFEDCYTRACERMGRNADSKEAIAFDATDPAFWEVYFDEVHRPLEREGVDFWWIDWQQGKRSKIPGLDPLWALNHYHTLDCADRGKRPLILSRYAGLGSHRYPLGFSGDTICTWKSLDFQPYFTNSAANAGYTWWSHDIGGHMQGKQDDELYLRWLQYGVFSPINRLHSSNSDFMGKEPWKRCASVRDIAVRFLRLRHKLIPYLYSANWMTHSQGTPICMPLYYRYPCQNAQKAINQYLFGSQLMVCPVTAPMDPRLNLAKIRAWLPKGRWTDIFTGQSYRGGQWVNLYRDLDSIPVLAPQGAIIPMYRQDTTNDLSLSQPLDIMIYRGNGSFCLFEDDGESDQYRHGQYATTAFTQDLTLQVLTFTIHRAEGERGLLPTQRSMRLCFRDITDGDIFVNGEPVESFCYDHVEVLLNISPDVDTLVEIRNWNPARNKSKREQEADILTRVQGSNRRKSKVFPSQANGYSRKKLPVFIADCLSELDAME